MRDRPVHYLHSDGTLTCSGVPLEDAARSTDPPRITIRLVDATCHRCRKRALELAAGAAS